MYSAAKTDVTVKAFGAIVNNAVPVKKAELVIQSVRFQYTGRQARLVCFTIIIFVNNIFKQFLYEVSMIFTLLLNLKKISLKDVFNLLFWYFRDFAIFDFF